MFASSNWAGLSVSLLDGAAPLLETIATVFYKSAFSKQMFCSRSLLHQLDYIARLKRVRCFVNWHSIVRKVQSC